MFLPLGPAGLTRADDVDLQAAAPAGRRRRVGIAATTPTMLLHFIDAPRRRRSACRSRDLDAIRTRPRPTGELKRRSATRRPTCAGLPWTRSPSRRADADRRVSRCGEEQRVVAGAAAREESLPDGGESMQRVPKENSVDGHRGSRGSARTMRRRPWRNRAPLRGTPAAKRRDTPKPIEAGHGQDVEHEGEHLDQRERGEADVRAVVGHRHDRDAAVSRAPSTRSAIGLGQRARLRRNRDLNPAVDPSDRATGQRNAAEQQEEHGGG